MINYKEFRDVYSKLPRTRICQKQSWDNVEKILQKEEDSAIVLVGKSPSQPNFQSAWLTGNGFVLYTFDINKEEQYAKGELIEDPSKLNLGSTYQYSLSKLKINQKMTPKVIEALFETFRQGNLPDKVSTSYLEEMIGGEKPKGKARKSTSGLSSKQKIVDLFKERLIVHLSKSEDPQTIFQRTREELTNKLGDERQLRLFMGIVPTWEKLFSAFNVSNSAKVHIQFFTTHILPIYTQVEWPRES